MIRQIGITAAMAFSLALAGPVQARVTGEMIDAFSAILGAGMEASEVSHLRQVPSVGVVNIGTFGDHRGESTQVKMYAAKLGPEISSLRHALSRNPVTRQAMAEHGIDAGSVVGVMIGATGSLRFFVQ